ncbi:helix-turn-helix transcriptional regulator [Streptomyces sp. NPDC004647]|uniref:helix-turn-helix domain-containing protein n=1 Tax=Streptomyces sp. NPDC004647 TaxID=3154671 RepID=UPI0033B4A94B
MTAHVDGNHLAPHVSERLGFLFRNTYPLRLGRPWTPEEVSWATGVPAREIRRMLAGEGHAETVRPCFAQRLQHLFTTRIPDEGGRYSQGQVARATGFTPQYISKLIRGESMPGLECSTHLAEFFGVPVSFFTDTSVQAVARHFGVISGPDLMSFMAATDGLGKVVSASGDHVSKQFPDLLNTIFQNLYPASRGRPFSDEDVATATGLGTDKVRALRSGQATPSLMDASKLAAFFRIPVGMFCDEGVADGMTADLALLAAYQDDRARSILRRSAGLPTSLQDQIDAAISDLRSAAGLPPDGDPKP